MALSTSFGNVVLFVLFVTSGVAQDHGQCTKTGSCICTFDDNWAIDLNSIGGYPFGPEPGPDYTYYYNYWPCETKDLPTTTEQCTGSVIQADDSYYPTWCYSCGLATNTAFGYDDNNELYIEYMGGEDDRKSKVILRCSSNDDPGTLTANGEQVEFSKEYNFILSSKWACPSSPGDQPVDPVNPGSSISISISISPGTIMCIIFICLVFVYVVGGVLVMKFYKGAEGREIVPNYGLWAAIPGLIKDGAIFFIGLFPCGKNLRSGETPKYDNL